MYMELHIHKCATQLQFNLAARGHRRLHRRLIETPRVRVCSYIESHYFCENLFKIAERLTRRAEKKFVFITAK